MKIGMWSDSVNFPNLPLMKLSSYHKRLGDSVEIVREGEHYDRVYLSKIFNLPLISKIPKSPPLFHADDVVRGGQVLRYRWKTGKKFSTENCIKIFLLRLNIFIQIIVFIQNTRIPLMAF